MRDTFIAIVLFGVVTWGLSSLKDFSVKPKAMNPADFPTAEKVRVAEKLSQLKNRIKKGETHDQNTDRRYGVKTKGKRKDEGDSGKLAEAESLPSIYSKQDSTSSESTSAVKKDSKAKTASVHGVPIEAYLESQQNRLGAQPNPAPADNGMRIFFWCMELKNKKLQYDEKECEALVLKGTTDRRSSLY